MKRPGWVSIFAIAMGILEAVCVIYLRRLLLPTGVETDGIAGALTRFRIEHIREAATLLMLLSVAALAADRVRVRVAYFFLIFGIWDIVYYIGLWIFTGWPASPLTWDCLFLIPVPWFGPVLAPVLISVYFITACALLILSENRDRPLAVGWPVLLLQLAGFAVWYGSFVRQSTLIAADGYAAATYSWPLFGLGGLLCLIGLGLSIRDRNGARSRHRPS